MKKIIGSLLVMVLALSGCTNQAETKQQIITTVKPLTDITKMIVGDNYEVSSVFPEDSDPHHFELTAKNMKDIADSKMFVYISDTNNSFSKDLKNSGDYNTTFLNVTNDPTFKDAVDPSLYGDSSEAHDHSHEGEEDHDHESEEAHDHESEEAHDHESEEQVILNPHVWLSPKKLLIITDTIVENISELDPDNASTYEENGKKVTEKLEKLDQEYTEFAKTQKYPMIVAHDSAGYLESDYGIETVGIYDLTHESEPTAKEIEGYISDIKAKNIPVIYVEQNDLDNKLMKQISEESGAEIEAFNNLSTVGESGDTFSILEDNLTALENLSK